MVARVGSTPWSSSCARTSNAADANPRAPTGVAPPLGTGYGCRPSSSRSITRFAMASSMSARSPLVARTKAPQARARRIGTVDAGPSATSTSQSSPATADACAQAPAKLEVGAPPVTTMSQPRAVASAMRNSSGLALFPARPNPVRSSRLRRSDASSRRRRTRCSGVGKMPSESLGHRSQGFIGHARAVA